MPEHQSKPMRPNRLLQYRKRAGLSQKRVSYLMGQRSESRYSEWENGVTQPNLRNLLTLAYALNTPIEFLFYELAREVQQEVNGRRERLPGREGTQA